MALSNNRDWELKSMNSYQTDRSEVEASRERKKLQSQTQRPSPRFTHQSGERRDTGDSAFSTCASPHSCVRKADTGTASRRGACERGYVCAWQ
jgi:hypothetical protein